MNPYASEAALLELRGLVCQKNFDEFHDKVKVLPPLEKNQDSFVQYLTAQDLIQQKLWRKAVEVLIKVSEEDPQFPETYYFLTKAGEELGRILGLGGKVCFAMQGADQQGTAPLFARAEIVYEREGRNEDELRQKRIRTLSLFAAYLWMLGWMSGCGVKGDPLSS